MEEFTPKLRISIIAAVVLAVLITGISIFSITSESKKARSFKNLDKAEFIHERAEGLMSDGKYDKAVNAFLITVKNYPDSVFAERSLRKLASIYGEKGDLRKEVYYYKRLVKSFPKIKDAAVIKDRIENIKMKEMASSRLTEDSIEYIVQPGDSLYALARKFKTTVAFIKTMNGLKTDMIRVGQKLKINIAKFSIHVDKAKNILILKKDGEPFKTYPVATGRENSTPVGVFTIVDKAIRPIWTKPGVGIVMPDSDEYELGARWMAISAAGYGIHGTDDNSSIGGQTTSGCVRMFDEDVIELYDIVPKGTEVTIIDSKENKED